MGQLEQFLSDIAPNGDWQPLIDYINQNYVSKEKIRKKIKELEHEDLLKLSLTYKHDKEAQAQVQVLEELLEE